MSIFFPVRLKIPFMAWREKLSHWNEEILLCAVGSRPMMVAFE